MFATQSLTRASLTRTLGGAKFILYSCVYIPLCVNTKRYRYIHSRKTLLSGCGGGASKMRLLVNTSRGLLFFYEIKEDARASACALDMPTRRKRIMRPYPPARETCVHVRTRPHTHTRRATRDDARLQPPMTKMPLRRTTFVAIAPLTQKRW